MTKPVADVLLGGGMGAVAISAYFLCDAFSKSALTAFLLGFVCMAAPVVIEHKKKKKYKKPVLTCYGTVAEMTKGTGLTGNPDGAVLTMRKTG